MVAKSYIQSLKSHVQMISGANPFHWKSGKLEKSLTLYLSIRLHQLISEEILDNYQVKS